MNTYRYETHAHTSEVSQCGNVDAATMVDLYVKAGYTGIVVTDHYSEASFGGLGADPARWADHFLTGYRKAKEAAGGRLSVFLGMEIRFHENANDYLVYGVEEPFLYKHGDLLTLGIHRFCDLAHENGMLVFQAHPFRNGMTIVQPGLLDGVEVHNGNPRHDSRNAVTDLWADRFGYLKSSGSDFHEFEDLARGGICLRDRVDTQAQLKAALRNGAELIIGGE